MEKRATTAVDSHKVTENQALLVSEHPAKCRYGNTRDERHILKSPSSSEQRNSHMHSLPD